jgi:16S rRNA C1402 (ribose-2'-O) methylase RsmI
LAADRNQTKGEFVIVIGGYEVSEDESLQDAHMMASTLLEYLPASQAARVAAKLNNVPRREVYRLLDQ